MARKLTEKQRRFVEAYMGKAKGNGRDAAEIAGYKGNDATLRAVASENLTKPNIREAIDERVDNDPLVMSRQDLQEFWSRVACADDERMVDRLRASELLGKSRAEFTDRVEGSVLYRFLDPGEADSDDDWAQEAAGERG